MYVCLHHAGVVVQFMLTWEHHFAVQTLQMAVALYSCSLTSLCGTSDACHDRGMAASLGVVIVLIAVVGQHTVLDFYWCGTPALLCRTEDCVQHFGG